MGFRSHERATSSRLLQPLQRPLPERIEAVAEFRRQTGRPKAETPKVHIGFRLAPDVVASVRASGAGYNVRVEQALRKAGFGAKAKKRKAKKVAANNNLRGEKLYDDSLY